MLSDLYSDHALKKKFLLQKLVICVYSLLSLQIKLNYKNFFILYFFFLSIYELWFLNYILMNVKILEIINKDKINIKLITINI